MRKRTRATVALTAFLAITGFMLLAGALSPLPVASPPRASAPRRQDTDATAPFRIDGGMLMTIQSLPAALTDTLTASLKGRTEIIAATHTFNIPLEPLAPRIEDVWCLTLYPPAPVTVYAQRYIPPPTARYAAAGDYVAGRSDTYRIDRVLAAKRSGVWELYHPEVYPWTALGC